MLVLGENPLEAVRLLIFGSFGYAEAIGYTLFYATSFIFTGLAVAIAFHCGLFNIGGEGEAYVGGLGVVLVGLHLGWLPWPVVVPLAILAAAAFGGFWAFIPGWLQARRGSHVVITTIMFNFIASALMTYLLVNVLIAPGLADPRDGNSAAERLAAPDAPAHGRARHRDRPLPAQPVVRIRPALLPAVLAVRRRDSPCGYALRVVGQNETAAVYGGISPARQIMLAMAISGALAGLGALNMIMGAQHRMTLDFTGGFDFVGIAVALMGRNHPVGIILASLLFGALYQGRLGAVLRHAGAQPRHRRGDSGLGDPVRRGARAHVPPLRGSVVRAARAGRGGCLMDQFLLQVLLLTDSTIRLATPLVLAALAGLFAERSGVVDIGLEGKMLGAAFAAAATAAVTGSAWLGLAVGIAFSILLAMVHGFACITNRGNQVVSGMALNIMVAGLGPTLAEAWFQQGGRTPLLGEGARFTPITLPLADALRGVPVLGPIYADLISGHNILVYATAAARPWSPGSCIAPASACACAPSARTRARSTPPGSASPRCATKHCW